MTLAPNRLAALVLVLAIASLPVAAQPQRIYSQAELDQMLAPVALYPDPLLSQVLMAATYPRDVFEAARWSRGHPGLQGDDAVRAAQGEDWDPSVQSLAAFPQILDRMEENPDWTHRLGEAFLAQEPQVMDTVQQLRRRAQAAGNLQSSDEMHVLQQGEALSVQSVSPQYVYVPYYDPLVVYGQWWWPAYQPVVWAPWPGYVRPYRPGASVSFWWGRPVGLSAGFFFGSFDWHHRHVRVVRPTAYYYRPPAGANRTVIVAPHRWQHEPRPAQARQPVRAESLRRHEPNATIPPQRHHGRAEPQHDRFAPRPAASAPPLIPVRPADQGPPSAPVQPRRDPRNEPMHLHGRHDTRPDGLPPQARTQGRPEPGARHPESVAAQPPRPRPEIRPQDPPRQQQPQRPRAESQERRSDRGDRVYPH